MVSAPFAIQSRLCDGKSSVFKSSGRLSETTLGRHTLPHRYLDASSSCIEHLDHALRFPASRYSASYGPRALGFDNALTPAFSLSIFWAVMIRGRRRLCQPCDWLQVSRIKTDSGTAEGRTFIPLVALDGVFHRRDLKHYHCAIAKVSLHSRRMQLGASLSTGMSGKAAPGYTLEDRSLRYDSRLALKATAVPLT
jgi:hypothetical protein